MIKQIFEEIKNEARSCNIILIEDSLERSIRIGFNVVESSVRSDLPNFYIQDEEKFYKLLNDYVMSALEFYNLEMNYDSIKRILTFLWSNITIDEMNSLEKYIDKYINFINDDILSNKRGIKSTSIGLLKYSVSKQSLMQETPYCFQAYFQNEESMYALPRISFGISNGVCYIYAIQNKDSKINTDSKYNLKVKDALRTINSSVKKYRNITPSFVVVLSLFLSFLKENNISKIKVESPLPIRMMNRELVTNYRIQFETMQAQLDRETLEIFKQELIDKKLKNDYNSTVKFVNCFNRLKVHFDNIFMSKCALDDGIILEVIDLQTNNSLLKEIVENKNNYSIEKER